MKKIFINDLIKNHLGEVWIFDRPSFLSAYAAKKGIWTYEKNKEDFYQHNTTLDKNHKYILLNVQPCPERWHAFDKKNNFRFTIVNLFCCDTALFYSKAIDLEQNKISVYLL